MQKAGLLTWPELWGGTLAQLMKQHATFFCLFKHTIQLILEKHQWEQVVLVGGDFEHCKHAYTYFPDALEAKQWLKEKAFEQRTILIKGSRGIKMEQVLDN